MLRFVLPVLFLMFFVACKDNSNHEINLGSSVSNLAANLQTVSDDMIPTSLQYSSSRIRTLAERPGDPCENAGGFAQCMPILLKMYVAMSKQFLDMVISVVEGAGTNLGTMPRNSTGSISEGNNTYNYNYISETDFTLLVTTGGRPAMYLDVNNNIYTLRIDFAHTDFGDEEGPPAEGNLEVTVNFTNANTYSITSKIYNMACDSSDAGAPQNIKIYIEKSGGFWAGKSMMHHPHFSNNGSATCTTGSLMNIFTKFKGNDNATIAHIYLAAGSVNLASFGAQGSTTYELDVAGSNGNGYFDDSTASFAQPICASDTLPVSLISHWWEGISHCDTIDATVSATSFDSSSFEDPSLFGDVDNDIVLPSSVY